MIGFWLWWGFVILVLVVVGAGIAINSKSKMGILALVAGIVLAIAVFVGANWWLNNTAGGLRMQISWQSEIQVGLDRTARVFSATGELVYEFTGRFDINHNGDRLIMDVISDDGGARRHYIYAPAGVVIVTENP